MRKQNGNDFNHKPVTTIFFFIILRLRLLGNLKRIIKKPIWSLDIVLYLFYIMLNGAKIEVTDLGLQRIS